MAFVPTTKQSNAITAAKKIAIPLTTNQRAKYNTKKATDLTGANTWAAQKLGLTNYDASKAKLNPMQRYRYNQLTTTDPTTAKTYRNAVIARNAANSPTAAPTTTTPNTANDATSQVLFPETTDLSKYGSADYLNNMVSSYSDPSKSTTYQWRLRQGQDDLNKWLASKGLNDSGAAITAGKDLINTIGADEANSAYDRAYNAAQLAQTGDYNNSQLKNETADRLRNMLENNAERADRNSNTAWDRQWQVVEALLNQNPLSTAYGASTTQSKLMAQLAAALASGGEGESSIEFPSYSNSIVDLLGTVGNSNSNSDYTNIIGKILFG